MSKQSFILYCDNYLPIRNLSIENKAKILDAIFKYNLNEPLPEMDETLQAVFSFFKLSFDRNTEKYKNICERNKNNIQKRWEKENTKNTTRKTGIPEDTKNTDNDPDPDPDPDPDLDLSSSQKNSICKESTTNLDCTTAGGTRVKKNNFDYTIEFEKFWKCYPQREGNIDKRGAFSQWKARLKEGHTADEMIAGAKRYHTHSKAKGHIGTSYVKMAKTFLGQGKHFLEQWKTFDFPTLDDALLAAKQPEIPPIIKQMLVLCGSSFDRKRLTEAEFRYRFMSAYKTIRTKILERVND